jgi:dienelactone hydrolase
LLKHVPEPLRSLAWAGTICAACLTAVTFFYIGPGLGHAVDGLIGAVLAWALTQLGGLLVGLLVNLVSALLLLILRRPPFWRPVVEGHGRAVGMILAGLALSVPWPAMRPLPGVTAFALVFLPAWLVGLAVGLVRRHGWRRFTAACLGGALVIAAAGYWWLIDPGAAFTPQPIAAGTVRPLDLPDPADPGPYAVRTLTYGSGTYRWQEAYGAGAAIKTQPVDMSATLPALKGWKALVRKLYWGFDATQFPVNGRVWYPEGGGPFPLVLIVHGNHAGEMPSDPGYAYLGELLASRGYIAVSVDENFINGSLLGGDLYPDIQARADMLLKHLEQWRTWNKTAGNPFRGKVDMNHIALIGHSRGGEAVAMAAETSSFHIQAVVALAPLDDEARPHGQPMVLHDTSYLLLQGGNDDDMSGFQGIRQFQRTTYTASSTAFSGAVFAYHMNHGNMNTSWIYDYTPATGWLFSRNSLLPGADQRQIVKTYVSAFLEDALKGNRAYRPLFQDYRYGARWLPGTEYASLYKDSRYSPVLTYDFDAAFNSGGGYTTSAGLTSDAVKPLETRKGVPRRSQGAFLSWPAPGPAYTIYLPKGGAPGNTLVLTIADYSAPSLQTMDFTLELAGPNQARTRLPLGQFGSLLRPRPIPVTKYGLLDFAVSHAGAMGPVFQQVAIPLPPGYQGADLQAVTLWFDRTPAGTIVLDEVGFR